MTSYNSTENFSFMMSLKKNLQCDVCIMISCNLYNWNLCFEFLEYFTSNRNFLNTEICFPLDQVSFVCIHQMNEWSFQSQIVLTFCRCIRIFVFKLYTFHIWVKMKKSRHSVKLRPEYERDSTSFWQFFVYFSQKLGEMTEYIVKAQKHFSSLCELIRV